MTVNTPSNRSQPADVKTTGYAASSDPAHCLATFAADGSAAFEDPFMILGRGERKLFIGLISRQFFSSREGLVLGRARRLMLGGAVAGTAVVDLVNSLNVLLCGDGPTPPIAVLCADFDFETRDLTYVTAGQYALTIGGDSTVQALDAGGTALGRDRGYTYFEETAHLRPGDLLTAYNHHLALDFRPDRLVEIAREGMRAGEHAALIRDRVAREWSGARCDHPTGTLAAGLFFTTSAGPAAVMPAGGRPTIWEAEYKESWAGGLHRFQAQDHWYPVGGRALKAA